MGKEDKISLSNHPILMLIIGAIVSTITGAFVSWILPGGFISRIVEYGVYRYEDVTILFLGIILIFLFLVFLTGILYFNSFSKNLSEIKNLLKRSLNLVEREELKASVIRVYTYCRWVKFLGTEERPCNWTFHLSCEQRLMTAEGCLDRCYRYEELPRTPTGSGLLTGAILGILGGGLLFGAGGAILGGILGGLLGHSHEVQEVQKMPAETEFSRKLKECKEKGCSYYFSIKT